MFEIDKQLSSIKVKVARYLFVYRVELLLCNWSKVLLLFSINHVEYVKYLIV